MAYLKIQELSYQFIEDMEQDVITLVAIYVYIWEVISDEEKYQEVSSSWEALSRRHSAENMQCFHYMKLKESVKY